MTQNESSELSQATQDSTTRLLIRKVVNESFFLFLACAFMLCAFCWARVWIVCQFDLQQFEPLLKQFKAFERFTPVPLEQFLTYAGNIALTYQEPVVFLCIVVWGVSRGSDVVSGELGRGTLEMLISQPISRSKLLWTHAAVCITGLFILASMAWLGIAGGIMTNSVEETIRNDLNVKVPFLPLSVPIPVGESLTVQTPLQEKVPPEVYIAPSINLFAFGFFLLALSSMLSCFDRYRWRTIGFVIGIYVIQLLIFLLSKATDWTGFCEYGSFFSLYQPDAIVHLLRKHPECTWEIFSTKKIVGWGFYLGPFGMSLMLILFGISFYLIGWWRFVRRDLPAPL